MRFSFGVHIAFLFKKRYTPTRAFSLLLADYSSAQVGAFPLNERNYKGVTPKKLKRTNKICPSGTVCTHPHSAEKCANQAQVIMPV